MKKTLLLIIDNLTKGGAEVLLVGILPELNKKYEVILVTLTEDNHFPTEYIICKKKYTLGFNSKLSFFSCVFKLKKIIKENNPALIHSHLFYSSLIARLACPSRIRLIYSLHNEMSKSVFCNSRLLTFMEKNTIKKNHTVIAVSNEVIKDYKNTIKRNLKVFGGISNWRVAEIKVNGEDTAHGDQPRLVSPPTVDNLRSTQAFVLRNYISDIYFKEKPLRKDFSNFQRINLVALGNIKDQKNYIYLIKAFRYLKEYNISLDIYGRGNNVDIKILSDEAIQNNLSVSFKGIAENPYEILPHYDLYVSCSKHEGFGIAAIEAMSLGLPLLLSDLSVYHEVTFNNALFFDIQNPASFIKLIKEIFENKHDLDNLSVKGSNLAKKYTKEIYLNNLFGIYDKMLNYSNESDK